MKRKRKKHTRYITDAILLIVALSVFAVGFTYKTAVPIIAEKKAEAIYRGNPEKTRVSLMFNVYENTPAVLSILNTLSSFSVKATFFVGGCWADDNAEALKRIVSEGHEIANHGYFHKDHKKLEIAENLEEIDNTGKVIEALSGVKPTLFAPPSGSFSDKTLDAASELGYKLIMWSKDTIDWRDKDKNLILSRATKNLKNGDLVLMHPKNHTAEILPEIISFYITAGFSVVSVSENLT